MTSDRSAKPAETLTVRIQDLSRSGPGIARDESGRVIFVPYTAPGELVEARIVEEKKHFAEAVLVRVIEPAAIRQEPPCALFGRCGGCQWQHLPYELQWKTKVSGVRHALTRVQLTELPEIEELPAERVWEYRNRIQLRGFQKRIGFHAKGSNDLVPADRCELARPEINAAWEDTRWEGSRLAKPFKVEVEVLPTGKIRRVWNSPHAAAGFRQVHDEQNEKLRAWVASSLTGGRVLYDLFGGSGNFALALAPRMERIHCVDVSSPERRPEGTPANVEFHRSSVLSWLLRRRPRKGGAVPSPSPASAVIDPPRSGLGKDLGEIALSLEALGVDELLAVGCDPDAWAADVSRLVKRGWRLERLAATDLFPQTPHVESLALLRRRS